MKKSNQVFLCLILVEVLDAPLSSAQTAAARQFEVVSIKRDMGCDNQRAVRPSPNRLTAECRTVKSLIQIAYGAMASGLRFNAREIEVSGGPAWSDSEYYDIVATAKNNTTVEQMMGPMMQEVLENRFKLKLHRETKETAVYSLVVAKGGVKLEQTKEGSCISIDLNHLPPPPVAGQPRPNFCGNPRILRNGSVVTITANRTTLTDLANALSRVSDRPILDKTGLSGLFDFQLSFVPDSSISGMAGPIGAGEPSATLPLVDGAGPSIFSALQQLGLRLESAKYPVEILVVDHLERPSEN
jgi:uncharacterized protein (TIGR03435 family)